MRQHFALLIFLAAVVTEVQSTNCNQIQESQIFDGNEIDLLGDDHSMQLLPANSNCNYKIPAPLNTTVGYYAYVTLSNGLIGVNDYISVIDTTGVTSKLNNRSWTQLEYYVIPGREMSLQVVTKSVLMNSQASIHVKYSKAKFGPTLQMETGSTMNIIDLNTLRGSQWYSRKYSSSVAYVGSEQIYVTACTMHDSMDQFRNIFIIDGSIYDQKKVYTVDDLTFYKSFTTTNNTVTVLSFQDPLDDLGIVLNPISEASQFNQIMSMSSVSNYDDDMKLEMSNNERQAVQVVDFESRNITLDTFFIESYHCKAYIVDGPPNNSSKVVMDLSNADRRWTPVTFNMSRFSLIADPCSLRFTVQST